MMERLQAEKYNMFPLSLSQQNIWSLEQACQGTSINNIGTTLRIRGRVDLAVLQKSVDLVLASDASLRTRITLRDCLPMQYQVDFVQEQFPVYDFTQTSPKGIEKWEQAVTRETIPLLDAPLYRFVLFRTGEHEGGLLMKLHHIISDGWSQLLLCNRIGQTYLDLLSGRQPELEPSPSYELHVRQEADYISSPAYERDEAYWSSVLAQAGEPSVLKTVKSAAVSPVGRRRSFMLPQALNNDIYAFCTQNRVAPFSVLYLALAIYFKRIGGADRFTIGVPIFNRTNYTFKQTSGMFVSTLPFFNELRGEWSLSECSEHLTEKWLEMLRHQRLPFSHIQRLAQQTGGGDGRLFHIALSYQNGQMLTSRDASVSFSGRWHYSGYQMEQLCIHLSNLENGRRYAIDYDYLTQVFSEQDIEELHGCLLNILRESLAAPDKPVCRLPVLSVPEREKVLYSFNRTEMPLYDDDLYERFSGAAALHPERAALICGGERTSYRRLEKMSAQIQLALETAEEEPCLAAVLLPREPALLASMMGVLRAGWAFVILAPGLPANRLREILKQSGAAVLLTEPAVFAASGLEAGELAVINVQELGEEAALPAAAPQESLAYVVYTSGSTGTPKGVEISRRSLLNLAASMAPVYGKGAVLSMCSVGFDAFLLESAVALLNGQTVLLPADADLESPRKLAELIVGYGVGFLCTTPSRLSELMKHPDFYKALRRMESLVCGGEAFPGDLLHRLQQATEARIYNQYGPSETTVGVSLKLLNRADVITAGGPMPNCRLYILDQWMSPLPVGVYGDLYIGGMCVGMGYRGRPALTDACFLESPFEMGERIYRTGDTACWTADGEIILGGRTDKQVKLRGLRIEPQEVSACLNTHPQVKQSAAAVMEQEGQNALIAYYTSDVPVPEEELRSFAASYLPGYMVPAVIIRLDSIPLSGNGKVDEARLPDPSQFRSDSRTTAPETDLERTLLDIFSQVLGKEEMGADSDYFLCGGNSLNAMETIGRVADLTGFSIRVADLYTCRNARRLAAVLEGTNGGPSSLSGLQPAPKQDRYPLSPVQQGIYVQSCVDPTGLAYQMPGAFRMDEAPDIARLRYAFHSLIEEEPLLRTAFVQEPEGIFAEVMPAVSFDLPVICGGSFEEACSSLLIPFQLDQAPLLRAALWEENGIWTLLINLHHIIGDGLTTPVLMGRLDALYQGGSVGKKPLSYLDYAWQLSKAEKDPRQLEYWKKHLTPLPEPMELPVDFVRSHSFDYRGDSVSFSLGETLSAACDGYCAEKGISSYMFFLAAFGLLLSRLSGRDQLIVGAPSAGRILPETQNMCGPFINTLPLRLSPDPEMGLEDYLRDVRDEVNRMLDHQQAGLEEITSALELPRSLSQSPLYQVMLSQRPIDAGAFSLGGGKLTYRPVLTGTAKMDLVAELAKEGGCYSFGIEYASSLFERETILFWCRCLKQLIQSMIAGTDCALCDLIALSPGDRVSLIDKPNHTATPFVNLPIHTLIAQQAEIEPDAKALIFHDQSITRAEMERRACRIANLLCEAGAEPGGKVGLAIKRGPNLVAAMMGILKAGCAYVPLLASFPEQRLQYMMETAQITHVLCDEAVRAVLPKGLPCTLVDVEGRAPETFVPVSLKDSDLCNILFTSGSTGKPKGVMMRHRSVSNMFLNMSELLGRAEGPILCSTNLVFDTFIGETLVPLAMGKRIVMCDEEEMMLPWKAAELICRYGVEIVQFTPARLQMCLSNEAFCQAAGGLKLVLYGGEVLTPVLLEKTCQVTDAITVNMYGPTEATVYMTMVDVRPGKPIPIGRPLKNGRIYVLDQKQRPVLPTAYGELWLAGEVLSGGYISRPDLTEQAFRPDPFFPGELMYRTGDIARLRLDGCYDFQGRKDAQVKLNGQRVELDEITGAIMTSGCALLAATVPVRHEDGSMQLCSFYQPAPDGKGGEEEILRHLRTVLPVYMIPSRLVALEQMPHTPSGKIDLRTLKETAASYDEASVFPIKSETEQISISASAESGSGSRKGAEQADVNACRESAAGQASGKGSELLVPNAFQEAAGLPKTSVPGVSEKSQQIVGESASKAPEESEQVPGVLSQGDFESQEKTEDPKFENPEALLTELWSKVLGRKDLNPEESFFRQGGTSLAALSVLSHYHNHKLVMSLQQFYENPTLREQAALLASGGQGVPVLTGWKENEKTKMIPAEEQASENIDFTEVSEKEISENVSSGCSIKSEAVYSRKVPAFTGGGVVKEDVGTVLLTGATGFLGAHILRELLDAGAERVLCLVRGGDVRRLQDTLTWYFGRGWTEANVSALEVVSGDITKPGLGLAPEVYWNLAEGLDSVWHCAADVRHYADDEDAFLATNLTGTKNIIKLARTAGVPLYHMSTGSVAGQRLEGSEEKAVFTEEDFCIGQDWHANLYVKSKFLAENAVFEAVRGGLNARVFRLGRLVGRSSDGTFQKNPESNAFWLIMRAIHALGAIPAGMAQDPVELTPIDWCAGAAVALRGAPLTVYHIQSPVFCTLEQAARAVAPQLEILSDEEFEERLKQVLQAGNGSVLAPLLDFKQRNEIAPVTITVTNELTMEQLETAGFRGNLPGPERTLRAFRFDSDPHTD